MTYAQILMFLVDFYPVRRRSWPEGVYIFKQYPVQLPNSVVGNMTSLSNKVKELIGDRTLGYSNQVVEITLTDKMASVMNFSYRTEDLFANDWEIYNGSN